MKPRSIIITGGGTAGHVFPALAVADALVETGYAKSEIRFVGSRRGMEGAIIRGAGFAIQLLPGRGISRRATLANLGALLGVFGATIWSVVMFVRRRPGVVVSVGGYASVACSVAAVALRIPIVVVNVDAVAGRVNRSVARHAVVSAVGFPGTQLPRSVITGAPVRASIESVTRTEAEQIAAKRRLAIPETSRCISIIGGSLGAKRLNELGTVLARAISVEQDLFIFHVVGERNYQQMHALAMTMDLGRSYRCVGFSDDMAALLSASDLVVCRAGAMTVSELAVAGTPAILFPLGSAPNDHQRANARALEEHGAAVVADAAIADADFVDLVARLIGNRAELIQMGAAARTLGHRGAARVIAGLVDSVARREVLHPLHGQIN